MKYTSYIVLVLFVALSAIAAFNSKIESSPTAFVFVNGEANIFDSFVSWLGFDLNKGRAADFNCFAYNNCDTANGDGVTAPTNNPTRDSICADPKNPFCQSLNITAGNNPTAGFSQTRNGGFCRQPYPGDPGSPTQSQYNQCLSAGGGLATGIYTPTSRGTCTRVYSSNYILSFDDLARRNLGRPYNQLSEFERTAIRNSFAYESQQTQYETARNAYLQCVVNQQRNNQNNNNSSCGNAPNPTSYQSGDGTLTPAYYNALREYSACLQNPNVTTTTTNPAPNNSAQINLSGRVTDNAANGVNGVQIYDNARTVSSASGSNCSSSTPTIGANGGLEVPRDGGRVNVGTVQGGWCTAMLVFLNNVGNFPVQIEGDQAYIQVSSVPSWLTSDVGYVGLPNGASSDYFGYSVSGGAPASIQCTCYGDRCTALGVGGTYIDCGCSTGGQAAGNSCNVDPNNPNPRNVNALPKKSTAANIFDPLFSWLKLKFNLGSAANNQNLKIGTTASNGEIVFDGQFIDWLKANIPPTNVDIGGLIRSSSVTASNGNRTISLPAGVNAIPGGLVARYEKDNIKTTKTISVSGGAIDFSITLNIGNAPKYNPNPCLNLGPRVSPCITPNFNTPKISSFAPLSGIIDDTIVIKGSNFSDTDNKIWLDEQSFGPLNSNDGKNIEFIIPNIAPEMLDSVEASSFAYQLKVENSTGTASKPASNWLTIYQEGDENPMTITSITPVKLKPGKVASFSILGINLSNVKEVRPSDSDLSLVKNSLKVTNLSNDRNRVRFKIKVAQHAALGTYGIVLSNGASPEKIIQFKVKIRDLSP